MIDLSQFRTPPAVAGEAVFEAARLAWLADLASRLPDWDASESESDPAVKFCETGAARELILIQAANDAGGQCMLPWAKKAALDALAANVGIVRLAGESDDSLRLRAAAALPGSSVAGPQSSYERLTRAASPLVSAAKAARTGPGAITVTALVAPGTETLALDALPSAPGEAMRALIEAGDSDIWIDGTQGRILAGSAAVEGAGASLTALDWDGGANSLTATFSASVSAWIAAGGSTRSLFLHDGAAGVALPVSDATASGGGTQLSWAVAGAAERALLGGVAEDERMLVLVATDNPAAGVPNVDVGHTAREARMLTAVRAQLNRRDVRPMGDIVTVAAATLAAWSVTATISTASGADAGTVLSEAVAAVRAYGASVRQVGAAVKLGAVYAALYRPGVIAADIASPAADILSTASSAPDLTTVEVTLT